MGAKYVLMFEDEIFLQSINKAKWNIYISFNSGFDIIYYFFFKEFKNLNNVEKAKDIFLKILEEEKLNKIPEEIYEKGKKNLMKNLIKLIGINIT